MTKVVTVAKTNKRSASEIEQQNDSSDIDISSSEEEEEEDEKEDEIVDVDFDYFDLNPEVDFAATKTLLTQLFGDDSVLLDISGLAELLLADGGCGGTAIKTDGKTGDPLALLAMLRLDEHRSRPCVKGLVDYILAQTKRDAALQVTLRKILAPEVRSGYIFCERIINMPVEVVPPMYRMMMEAQGDSSTDQACDYYVIVSKVYELVAGKESLENDSRKKRHTAENAAVELDYFHYEDTVLETHAERRAYAQFQKEGQDSDLRRVFLEYGIRPRPSYIVISKDQLEVSVAEMAAKFPPF